MVFQLNHLVSKDDLKISGKDDRKNNGFPSTVKIFGNKLGNKKGGVLIMKRGKLV